MALNLKAQLGGNICPIGHHKPGWKPSAYWRLSNRNAIAFVERIYPYLRIKNNQALVLFGFDVCRPGSGRTWDAGVMDLLVRQLKWLNHKGTSDPGSEPMEEALNAAC